MNFQLLTSYTFFLFVIIFMDSVSTDIISDIPNYSKNNSVPSAVLQIINKAHDGYQILLETLKEMNSWIINIIQSCLDGNINFDSIPSSTIGKALNTLTNSIISKVFQIIADSIEGDGDVANTQETGIENMRIAFKKSTGRSDENFIETVRDMVAVVHNNDMEDKKNDSDSDGDNELERLNIS